MLHHKKRKLNRIQATADAVFFKTGSYWKQTNWIWTRNVSFLIPFNISFLIVVHWIFSWILGYKIQTHKTHINVWDSDMLYYSWNTLNMWFWNQPCVGLYSVPPMWLFFFLTHQWSKIKIHMFRNVVCSGYWFQLENNWNATTSMATHPSVLLCVRVC